MLMDRHKLNRMQNRMHNNMHDIIIMDSQRLIIIHRNMYNQRHYNMTMDTHLRDSNRLVAMPDNIVCIAIGIRI